MLKNASLSSHKESRPQPDWNTIDQELRKKGVTLQLLWEGYRAIYPDGYQASQFNEYYKRWKKKTTLSMRQSHKAHKAGEKMFVDYASQTFPLIDNNTGEVGYLNFLWQPLEQAITPMQKQVGRSLFPIGLTLMFMPLSILAGYLKS